MAQIEIYDFLKKQRITKNNDFFSASEIYKLLSEASPEICGQVSIYGGLIQLEAYGYLDVKRQGKLRDWHRAYRLKLKYCNGAKKENASS